MKMLLLLLLSMILGAVSGCFINTPIMGGYEYSHRDFVNASVRVIPIWIDKGFGQADLLSIEEGIDQWNYALNGSIVLRVVDTHFDMESSKIAQQVRENGWLFMRVDSTDKGSFIPQNVGSGYHCIGFAERVGGNHLYLVRDRLNNDEVRGVTMHEIGHLLGSPHIGDRLMRPHFSRATSQCIDYQTIVKVAEWQGIPVDKLNYCIDIVPTSKSVKKS